MLSQRSSKEAARVKMQQLYSMQAFLASPVEHTLCTGAALATRTRTRQPAEFSSSVLDFFNFFFDLIWMVLAVFGRGCLNAFRPLEVLEACA